MTDFEDRRAVVEAVSTNPPTLDEEYWINTGQVADTNKLSNLAAQMVRSHINKLTRLVAIVTEARREGRQHGRREAAPVNVTKARLCALTEVASAAQLFLNNGNFDNLKTLTEALNDLAEHPGSTEELIAPDSSQITVITVLGTYADGGIRGVHYDFPDTKDSTTVEGYYFCDGREDHDGKMIGPFATEFVCAQELVLHLMKLSPTEHAEYMRTLYALPEELYTIVKEGDSPEAAAARAEGHRCGVQEALRYRVTRRRAAESKQELTQEARISLQRGSLTEALKHYGYVNANERQAKVSMPKPGDKPEGC